MVDTATYTSRVERIYERVLRARMVETLGDLAATFRDAGFTCTDPYDLSCDDYRWSIMVERHDLPEPVDISIEVAESLSYGDETDGINLGLNIVAYGGEIIGGLCPFNWTPQVWADVRDLREVVYRMDIIAHADRDECVRLVEDWSERHSA